MIRFYRDGFRIHRWGFCVRGAWIRGLVFGLDWTPGPWLDEPRTHSRLTVCLGIYAIRLQHANTLIKGGPQ